MTVKDVKRILEHQNDDAEVMIEYTPRRHEYITEVMLGVRATENLVVFLGVTELCDD